MHPLAILAESPEKRCDQTRGTASFQSAYPVPLCQCKAYDNSEDRRCGNCISRDLPAEECTIRADYRDLLLAYLVCVLIHPS